MITDGFITLQLESTWWGSQMGFVPVNVFHTQVLEGVEANQTDFTRFSGGKEQVYDCCESDKDMHLQVQEGAVFTKE